MKVKYQGFRNLQEQVKQKIIYLPFEIGDGGGVFLAQTFLAMGSGDLTGGVCLPLFRQNVLKFKINIVNGILPKNQQTTDFDDFDLMSLSSETALVQKQ